MRRVYASAAVGAVVLGAVAFWFRATSGRAVPDGPDKARLDALEQQVRDLQQVAEKPNYVRVAYESMPQAREGAPSPPSAQPNIVPAPSTKPPPRSRDEVHDALEARFFAQSTDATWANEARVSVSRGIAAVPHPGSDVSSIQCRESICRIEASHEDLEKFQFFTARVLGSYEVKWTGPTFASIVRTSADGRVESVAYLGREAASLNLDEGSP